MSCIARVWDNGDMTDCGNKTAPGNQHCIRHIRDLMAHHLEEIRKLQAQIGKHEEAVRELAQELNRL